MHIHNSAETTIDCVNRHLDDLVDRLGTARAVCHQFNELPRNLFELTFDEEFGIWVLRPAA